jgi:hypothetical protein
MTKKTYIVAGGLNSLFPVIVNEDGIKRATIANGFSVNMPAGGLVWASVETPDAMTFIGYPGFPGEVGDWHSTETQDIFAAIGYPSAVGTWRSTEATDIFSAFLTLPKTGTWHSTEATDRFSAAGVGRGEDGVFITTEAVDIFAAIGHTPISGQWISTETPDQFSAISTGVTATKQRRVFFVT